MDSLTLSETRALWFVKQGLAETGKKRGLADVLGATGWLRTLGGADIYIAARARRPGMTRGELDAAIVAGDLRVMPAARGCIYAVPSLFAADLGAINAHAWRTQTAKELAKIGKKLDVVEKLAAPVLAALTSPLTTDALRKALPAGSIPSFGDAGKKVGLSSPLPLVLRLLELDGRIERTLDGGKLDTDRYLWRAAAWQTPAGATTLDGSIANVLRAFLSYTSPITTAQVAAWSGMAQRDVKPVLEKLGAVTVRVDGFGEAWALPGEVAAAKKAPAPSGIALLAFEDNYLVPHGLGPVTAPKHHAIDCAIWGSAKPEALGTADHVLARTIVVDGLIAGFWEVDPAANGAVWHTFEPPTKKLASQLDTATAELATFLLDELGHAISFTLDTMDDVQQRADRIRALRDGKPAKKAVAAKTAKRPAAKKKR